MQRVESIPNTASADDEVTQFELLMWKQRVNKQLNRRIESATYYKNKSTPCCFFGSSAEEINNEKINVLKNLMDADNIHDLKKRAQENKKNNAAMSGNDSEVTILHDDIIKTYKKLK